MPLHTTKDPVKRAEHIADREEKENVYEIDPLSGGLYSYTDWPCYWLQVYRETIKEFADTCGC